MKGIPERSYATFLLDKVPPYFGLFLSHTLDYLALLQPSDLHRCESFFSPFYI